MTKKDLTREKALRLHYKMWTEMQEKLGDNPAPEERDAFKRDWCNEFICKYYNCMIRGEQYDCEGFEPEEESEDE